MLHTHFINGEWVAGQGHDLTSIDPAKNEVIWEGKSATASQIDDAINAARAALPAWSMKTVEERLEIIKIYVSPSRCCIECQRGRARTLRPRYIQRLKGHPLCYIHILSTVNGLPDKVMT